MEIEIIPLAKRKIIKRGIPENWIRDTITTPGQIVQGYGGRTVYQKKYQISGRKEQLLRVICETEGKKQIVVTAYLTSKISQYWR